MRVPDLAAIESLLEPIELPPIAHVRYEPASPVLDDVPGATLAALEELQIDLPPGSTIAVGVGSRGIHDISTVVTTTVEWLHDAGFEPTIVPSMGSHGGASASGQRAVLTEFGITPERLGCPIDARMDTSVVGTATLGTSTFDVHLATAALETDALLPINRIKPHTGFSGRIESGVCKLLVVGMGKQPGARTVHRYGKIHGFEPTIEASIAAIDAAVPILGGIGIVENVHDTTAHVVGLLPDQLIDAESRWLTKAREYLATLPFDHIDCLVVDEIGKDISGTGLDTNVVGRVDPVADMPRGVPSITRIYVRGLTEATHGNANGLGMADIVHRDVFDEFDTESTYTNALTSGSLQYAAIPLVLPDDRTAISAAVGSLGAIEPSALELAWISDTATLTTFRVSEALTHELPTEATIETWEAITFTDGAATLTPTDPPSASPRED